MNQEEEDDQQNHDICTRINQLSSIQYQQKELSKLAKQLQSQKDREKYIKVIEMSKIIQSKLDYLQQEKKRSGFDVRTEKTIDRRHSAWNLQYYNDSYNKSISSCCSQSSASDNATIATNHAGSHCSDNDDFLPVVFSDAPARHHTYNGHTYRIIDRATSLQFQSDSFSMTKSRRPSSPDTLIDNNKIVYIKPTFRKKQISFSSILPKRHSIELGYSSEEEEEEIVQSATIHVAVRRDASLFKIEKTPFGEMQQQDTATNTAPIIETNDTNNDTAAMESMQKNDKKEPSDAGLLTPPDSPQTQSQFDREISSESYSDFNLQPQIIHVHKKTHSSLKGLLKRSYQLNQYTITKTNSISLPPSFSSSSFLLYKTHNAFTGKSKLLLKVIIISLTAKSTEEQKRFGFTFIIHQQQQQQQQQDDAKFALAPDSLVKEALATWIHSQNALQQQLFKREAPLLPLLSKCDEILRDGRKLYIVYDTSLFPLGQM